MFQCDATKPHCDRCTRYGIICPGYPEKNLTFKDDTSVVRERAEKKYEKRRRMREAGESSSESSRLRPTPVHTESSTSSRSDTEQPTDLSEGATSLMQLPLLHPREARVVEEAVTAFLSQWQNPNVELWWDIINPARMTNLKPFTGDSLATALQAVSVMMVAIKQDPPSTSLRTTAAKIYGAALRSINQTLQDPDEWLKDNTVLAVILTALFEVSKPATKGGARLKMPDNARTFGRDIIDDPSARNDDNRQRSRCGTISDGRRKANLSVCVFQLGEYIHRAPTQY